MARVRGVVAAMAAVAVVGLGGCGGGVEPSDLEQSNGDDNSQSTGQKDTPTPTPDDSPTPNEDGEVIGKDEKVDATTKQEAEAFVLEFMDAYDQAWLTGKLSDWEAMYTEDCSRCVDENEYLSEVYGSGGRIEGGDYENPRPEVKGREADGTIRVFVPVTITAYQVFGNDARRESEEQKTETFWIEQAGNDWRVVAWN